MQWLTPGSSPPSAGRYTEPRHDRADGPTESAAESSAVPPADARPDGWRGIVTDWSSDREAFRVPWGKAMMWIFLLSDTFVFSSFLIGYMTVRMSTTAPWPDTAKVFEPAWAAWKCRCC